MSTLEILEWLCLEEIFRRYGEIETAYRGTLEWIFSQGPGISEWLQSGDGVIWVSGVPGSGKSTLMKYLADDRRTRECLSANLVTEDWTIATFFFSEIGSALEKTLEGLLRSLLHQILAQNRWAISAVFNQAQPDSSSVVASTLPDYDNAEWTLSELMVAFENLFNLPDGGMYVLLIIDGIDEYAGDKLELGELLKRIRGFCGPHDMSIVCVSSRPLNVFEEVFIDCRKLRLEEVNHVDMEHYVSCRLFNTMRIQRLYNRRPTEVQLLLDCIHEKASGSFIWVVWAVKTLLNCLPNGDSLHELQERLRELPPELEKMYGRMLAKVPPNYQNQSSRIFQIMEASGRMFMPSELMMCFADDDRAGSAPSFEEFWDTVDNNLLQVPARLNCVGAGLLKIHKMVRAESHPRKSADYTITSASLDQDDNEDAFGYFGSLIVNYLHPTVKMFLRNLIFGKPS